MVTAGLAGLDRGLNGRERRRSCGAATDAAIAESDRSYQAAVFESSENKGVMHQVFRQNEVDRGLLKAVLRACTK